MSKSGKFLCGAVIGGFIGAATALLLAPKPGRETREDLFNTLEKAKQTLRETSEDVGWRTTEVKENTSDKWIELRESQ
ncbi:YtxH domain-containing protein [Melghirimyces algeriensis]|uniref:YtxH-like protein n=1 Tax=Melghirimyces algeriensis TaxID=910412 RepID=A0A521CKN4_9BACL|nr:YtxH domain-containing protein [Melghirimyces algeriensis]SMO59998.1 YtxH-like protein [Melghirimyces algeriensis]